MNGYDHHDRIIVVVRIKGKKEDDSIGLSYRTEMEEMAVPDFESQV